MNRAIGQTITSACELFQSRNLVPLLFAALWSTMIPKKRNLAELEELKCTRKHRYRQHDLNSDFVVACNTLRATRTGYPYFTKSRIEPQNLRAYQATKKFLIVSIQGSSSNHLRPNTSPADSVMSPYCTWYSEHHQFCGPLWCTENSMTLCAPITQIRSAND